MAFAMILALIAMQAQLVSPPSPDDIVVVGQRMRNLKLGTKTDRRTGALRCVVKRASGDPVLDATMCDALLVCAKTVGTRAQMEACMTPPVKAYAAMLAERRMAAAGR